MPFFQLTIQKTSDSTAVPPLVLEIENRKLIRGLQDTCKTWGRLYAFEPLPVAPVTITTIYNLHGLEDRFDTHCLADKVVAALEDREQRQALHAKMKASKRFTVAELALVAQT